MTEPVIDWDPSLIKPEDIKTITRKPRWKKSGSMSSVHHRKVTGDLRELGGVGSVQNTNHQGSTNQRPVERRIEKTEEVF